MEPDEVDLAEILAEVSIESLEQYVGGLLPKLEKTTTSTQAPIRVESKEAIGVSSQKIQSKLPSVAGQDVYEMIEAQESIEEQEEEEEFLVEEIEYEGDAVNACPVKEEVFAPYWANNTRDQVLALLNLYPFEQYIHMETCKFPEHEMMCRKGCRCEQQYRLHRLLAFDPSNECRGIFSDWFRFPSYCICKCYDQEREVFGQPFRSRRLEKSLSHQPKSSDANNQNTAKDEKGREANKDNDKDKDFKMPNEGHLSNVVEGSSGLIDERVSKIKNEDENNRFFYANKPVTEFKSTTSESNVRKGSPR